MTDAFFAAIHVDPEDHASIRCFAERSGVPVERLRYYNLTHTLPTGGDLARICTAAKLDALDLELRLGHLSRRVLEAITRNAECVKNLLAGDEALERNGRDLPPLRAAFTTEYGTLYNADCLEVLARQDDDSVDVIFADPPFNLKKFYPSEINDDLKEQQYLAWSEQWLGECIRILKPGGSFFLWNLPRWNARLTGFLNGRLTFRHWIAVDIKYSLPIAGRLYPSHYALLYYCKGPKPKTFHPDRLPMEVCPECAADLRDYGGYKHKMNPAGVNLMDVWYDIPPVRHSKYKKRKGANELSVRLLDRVIELASDPGDLVFDPFGGSGTTYAVAELKQRRWLGAEIGPVDQIIERLSDLRAEREYLNEIRGGLNVLFTEEIREIRCERGLWTDESVRQRNGTGAEREQTQLELRERRRRKYLRGAT